MSQVVLICGGRNFSDYRLLAETLCALHEKESIGLLVHGDAPGADTMSNYWAYANPGVAIHAYPAKWELYGRSAGPVRNKEMLDSEHVDLVVAFPGGRGTAHMVQLARGRGIPVLEVPPRQSTS